MCRKLFYSLLLVAAVGIGCNKDDDNGGGPPPADTAAVISISLPAAGALYENGFILTIDGTATDTDVLESVRYEIRNKNNNAVLRQGQSSTGAVTFYRFGWSWTVSGITSTFPGTVIIISKDKYGYETTQSVDINFGF